jgi:hypothetical protein
MTFKDASALDRIVRTYRQQRLHDVRNAEAYGDFLRDLTRNSERGYLHRVSQGIRAGGGAFVLVYSGTSSGQWAGTIGQILPFTTPGTWTFVVTASAVVSIKACGPGGYGWSVSPVSIGGGGAGGAYHLGLSYTLLPGVAYTFTLGALPTFTVAGGAGTATTFGIVSGSTVLSLGSGANGGGNNPPQGGFGNPSQFNGGIGGTSSVGGGTTGAAGGNYHANVGPSTSGTGGGGGPGGGNLGGTGGSTGGAGGNGESAGTAAPTFGNPGGATAFNGGDGGQGGGLIINGVSGRYGGGGGGVGENISGKTPVMYAPGNPALQFTRTA